MTLNDLDISSTHLERLVRDAQSSSSIAQSFLDREAAGVRADVVSLLLLQSKIRATLRAGIEQLFNQLLRPKLRATFMQDVYRDVSYVLTDEEYASAEYVDVVRKRFVKSLDGLLDGYKVCLNLQTNHICGLRLTFFAKDSLTEPNFRLFFGLLIDVLIRPWEKFVLSMRFNEVHTLSQDSSATIRRDKS
jgi:conserved oligomeric Golgi complex subunit 4